MPVNAFEELVEISKELGFENISVVKTQAFYYPTPEVAELLLRDLQRDDMYWDDYTFVLDGSRRFPDKLYSSSVVPLGYVWVDFGCGGFGFNPNLETKTYFVDSPNSPEGDEIEMKIDEIMSHYNYTKVGVMDFP